MRSHKHQPGPSLAASLLCFVLSGASGLIYQVVWMRELTLVFGATTLAVSTVLAVFMGGLALGSLYGGSLADRLERPLRTYGIIEIAIAIYGALVPLLFAVLPSVYQPLWRTASLSFFTLSLVRFALAAAVLAVPTFLMGATLPILSRYVVTGAGAVGRDVDRLYTVNTVGAVVGAASAGLLLIPSLGMSATTLVASGLNLAAGIVALAAARREAAGTATGGASRDGGETSALGAAQRAALYGAFGASGVAALVYEVAWTRALSLVLGSSVYAFTIMLTTFLVGLALGAAVGAGFADRTRRPLLALAIVEVAVALSAFAGLFLIRELPYVFLVLYRSFEGSPAALLLGTRLLVAGLVMLVPTVLLGAVFPIAVRAAAGRVDAIGSTVGRLYSVNTLGAIVGAFAAGFLLIPLVGVEGSLVAAVVVNVAAALALALATRRLARAPRMALAGGLAVLAVLAVPLRPHWNPSVMATGVYRYAPSIAAYSRDEFYNYYVPNQEGEMVYHRDGVSATVTVHQQFGHFVLKVNGKPDATTAGDLPTQSLIAHIPLLVHPDPKTALIIGWGSGVTVGSALTHPLERVTAVELEPAVVEASHFFDHVNGRPLEDPRTELLVNDGRNVLVATDRRFDVIISEPSNPWLTGVANLFTKEYFEAGAAHLTPGGVFCQWLQIYEMRPEEVASLVATFSHAFPTVYVFRGAVGDLILVGAHEPIAFDAPRMAERMRQPALLENLERVDSENLASILSRLYLAPAAVGALAAGAPLNTDDNALIEFRAPLRVGSSESTQDENVAALERVSVPVGPSIKGADAALLAEMALYAIARGETSRAERFVVESIAMGETVRAYSVLGELQAAAGRDEQALAAWRRAFALDQNDVATNLNLGKYYLGKNNDGSALEHLDRVVAVAPENGRARHLRAIILLARNAPERALEDVEAARRDERYAKVTPSLALHYGRALRDLGRYDEAIAPIEGYVEQVPNDPLGLFELGQLYLVLGDLTIDEKRYRQAEAALLRAVTLDFTFAEAHRDLSLVYRKLGRLEEAEAEFELYDRFRLPE